MGDMSNEQAARVLTERADAWAGTLKHFISGEEPTRRNVEDYSTALRMGAAALRGWVKTADRLPTEDDAIEVHDEWGFTHKEVAVISSGWPFELLVKDRPAMVPGMMDIETIEKKTKTFPYWMPLPKLPEAEP